MIKLKKQKAERPQIQTEQVLSDFVIPTTKITKLRCAVYDNKSNEPTKELAKARFSAEVDIHFSEEINEIQDNNIKLRNYLSPLKNIKYNLNPQLKELAYEWYQKAWDEGQYWARDYEHASYCKLGRRMTHSTGGNQKYTTIACTFATVAWDGNKPYMYLQISNPFEDCLITDLYAHETSIHAEIELDMVSNFNSDRSLYYTYLETE